jgi:hypothetical protein
MAKNSVLLGKGSSQAFFWLNFFGSFVELKNVYQHTKKAPGSFSIVQKWDYSWLLILGSYNTFWNIPVRSVMGLGLFYLGLFIARCSIDYWRSPRTMCWILLKNDQENNSFLIPLTLLQPTTLREPYPTFRFDLTK